jgi:hypothetical protein
MMVIHLTSHHDDVVQSQMPVLPCPNRVALLTKHQRGSCQLAAATCMLHPMHDVRWHDHTAAWQASTTAMPRVTDNAECFTIKSCVAPGMTMHTNGSMHNSETVAAGQAHRISRNHTLGVSVSTLSNQFLAQQTKKQDNTEPRTITRKESATVCSTACSQRQPAHKSSNAPASPPSFGPCT